MDEFVRFVDAPTPIESAPRLAKAIGLLGSDLLVKRDDLVGLGGGGNKVRKLQYSCGAAVRAGAGTLVITGAPQSNHCRLTAAAVPGWASRSSWCSRAMNRPSDAETCCWIGCVVLA